MFYDLQYAKKYLNNSIIRLEGLPILVKDVAVNLAKYYFIYYNSLPDTKKNKIVFLNDASLSFSPIPLGMLAPFTIRQSRINTVFMYRMPTRIWKIGLNIDNYDIKLILSEGLINKGVSYIYENIIITNEFYNTVMGNYPSYSSAIRISDKTGYATAFSRKFCIYNRKLFYTTVGQVGEIKEHMKPILFERFSYLKQVLDRDR